MPTEFQYYLVKNNGLIELRRTRFKELYCQGKDHPHDVCAVARSKDEMRSMVYKYQFGKVDWNSIED